MSKMLVWLSILVVICGLAFGCAESGKQAKTDGQDGALAGAWRARIQFANGPFAEVKDLEFMYVFNTGGTMTESSNYDAAPPVPPAYGIWRNIGPHLYEARYEFYATRPPNSSENLPASTGWLPAGRGVLVDTITVSEDGQSFSSRINYESFDQSGRNAQAGGNAVGRAERIEF